MITRVDLETPHTPDEMEGLLRLFAEDRQSFTDEEVHLRRIKIIKDLLEEYQFLYAIARKLDAKNAYLNRESNQGPDAIIESQSGAQFTVQITVANQSKQTYFNRKLLSQRQVAFANTKKRKYPVTSKIVDRVLTTREGRLREQVQSIVSVIKKKIDKFYTGTNALVVGTRISLDDTCINYSWREDLKDCIKSLGAIQYCSVYLVNGEEVITLIETPEKIDA
jgi:hypothetical protein